MSNRAQSNRKIDVRNNVPKGTYTSRDNLPERMVVFGRTFEKHDRQGAMKIGYSDTENEKFLQFPEPDVTSSYEDRVVQGVVAKHNERKLRENGITPISDYDLAPLLVDGEAYLGMYGELVTDDEAYFRIPPGIEDEHREDLIDTGGQIYSLMLEGEVAYLENSWSWLHNTTNNRAIDQSGDIIVTDMGELGAPMFGRYEELVESDDESFRPEDFVFDSFDQAPYHTENEFLEAHGLDETIDELLDPRLSELEIAQITEEKKLYS